MSNGVCVCVRQTGNVSSHLPFVPWSKRWALPCFCNADTALPAAVSFRCRAPDLVAYQLCTVPHPPSLAHTLAHTLTHMTNSDLQPPGNHFQVCSQQMFMCDARLLCTVVVIVVGV